MNDILKSTEEQFHECIDSLDIILSESECELQLSSFIKLKLESLPYIFNVEHLANLNDISSKQLQVFISDP